MWLTNSSVGRKLVMSISGLFLILFLTFHMSMNAVAMISSEAYNTICGLLGSNWYAVAGTAVLAAGVVVHFAFAIMLTLQNKKARGSEGYSVNARPANVEWASKNMFALGIIVLVGIILHLKQFWAHMMLPELAYGVEETMIEGTPFATTDGAGLIAYYFKNPIVCILYLVWFAALWFHLTHGIWSSLHTMGLNNKTWMKRIECISNIWATLVCIGFAAVVVYGYFFA